MRPFQDPAVAEVFDGYPQPCRDRLLVLRELIFDTAAAIEGVGPLHETLKWGEPSYLTPSKSGTTVRIATKRASPEHYGLYVHCQTNLVTQFRGQFPDVFTFEGDRALIFHQDEVLPTAALSVCIGAALTYHRDKRR